MKCERIVLFGLALNCSCTALFSQDPVENAMRESIEKQKASVRRQISGAVPQANSQRSPSFFTVDWPVLAYPATATVELGSVDCESLSEAQVGPLIRDSASRQGLDEDLVRAVIDRESAFKPCAVSPKGAQGLMQLMPATAKELGIQDVFDPKQNIDAGTRYLKQLLSRYNGSIELALAAYNAGSTRVDKAAGVPQIPETKTYVLEILSKLLF